MYAAGCENVPVNFYSKTRILLLLLLLRYRYSGRFVYLGIARRLQIAKHDIWRVRIPYPLCVRRPAVGKTNVGLSGDNAGTPVGRASAR